jgi:hypothetical protein
MNFRHKVLMTFAMTNAMRLNRPFVTEKCRFERHIKPAFLVIPNHINELAWFEPIPSLSARALIARFSRLNLRDPPIKTFFIACSGS